MAITTKISKENAGSASGGTGESLESAHDPEVPLAPVPPVTPRRRARPSVAELGPAVPTEDPVDRAAAAASPFPSLESRLRKETDGFRFDSLINGVSTNGLPQEQFLSEEPAEVKSSGPMVMTDTASYSNPPVASVPSLPPVPPVPPNAWGKRAVLAGGVTLCLALVLSGYAAFNGKVQAPQRSNGAADSAPAATSTAVSRENAPARQPGLPNPALTPGQSTGAAALPANAGTLVAAPPPIDPQVRGQVLVAYGIPEDGSERQVLAYLIPPSLNGTNSAANVFPVTPWFADLKRRLDRQLTQKVERREMTLAAAQRELATNWISAAHRHYVRNYGETDSGKARKMENQLNWESASRPSDGTGRTK